MNSAVGFESEEKSKRQEGPEGAQPRSWALEGPLDFYWPYSPTMLEVGKVSIQGPILSKISTRRHTASMGIL